MLLNFGLRRLHVMELEVMRTQANVKVVVMGMVAALDMGTKLLGVNFQILLLCSPHPQTQMNALRCVKG
jgi:hypothetical protein